MTIEQLDDHRPHCTIRGIKSVHVVPMKMLEDLATGGLKGSEAEGLDDFLPQIITEWLGNLDYT